VLEEQDLEGEEEQELKVAGQGLEEEGQGLEVKGQGL
jgi:hypothetical protein